MAPGVEFDEDQSSNVPIIRPRPTTAADILLGAGIATTPGNASALILAFACALIIASFYLIVTAIPEAPILGADVPMPGEVIPSNRAL